VVAKHYNPDLMTAPAGISINGGPSFHVNFASTFSWNQFWNLTIPVRLRPGANTIRSDTAPNIDQITLAPFQLPGT